MSPLLPTPTAVDPRGARNATSGRSDPDSKHHAGTTLGDVVYPMRMLPTPTSRDGKGANQRRDDSCLPGAVGKLLPTPAAADGLRGPDYARASREGSGGDDLVTTMHKLLPTPTTQPSTGNGHARNLGREVKMLPTPTMAASLGGNLSRSGSRSDELLLPGIAKAVSNGASTSQPSDATKPSEDQHPTLFSEEP